MTSTYPLVFMAVGWDILIIMRIKYAQTYILGDPRHSETSLGPCVKTSAADWVRKQIKDAIAAGAKALIDESDFPMSKACLSSIIVPRLPTVVLRSDRPHRFYRCFISGLCCIVHSVE